MDQILRTIIIAIARLIVLVAGVLLIRVDSENPAALILLPAIGVFLMQIFFWAGNI